MTINPHNVSALLIHLAKSRGLWKPGGWMMDTKADSYTTTFSDKISALDDITYWGLNLMKPGSSVVKVSTWENWGMRNHTVALSIVW